MQYSHLYIGILIGLTGLFLLSLGNGVWDRPAAYDSWNYQMFVGVCHQLPERSFTINGVPMAVNARCFGIFTALLAGWILMPAILRSGCNFRAAGTVLTLAVLIQIGDYMAGQFTVWNSSNFSRFLMGAILGAGFVYMVADQFRGQNNNQSKTQDYGSDRNKLHHR